MQYQQSSAPDRERMGRAIAELLGTDCSHVALEFVDRGYSGGVHRLRVRDSQGGSASLIVKKGPVGPSYRFFQDVLAPFELNSPRMYGVIDGGDGEYLVMEHIPHEPPDWQNADKYRRAVDWLIRRDAMLQPELARVAELDYLQPFELGDFDARTAAIASAAEDRIDSLITDQWVRVLADHAERFEEAAEQVLRGPQTVVHNDFQMLNILFATGPRQGRLYVVDWTYPAVGTVFVDLATLVHVAPPELRSELVSRYLAAHPASDFTAHLAAAQMHVHLSILTWMVDALRSGHAHAVNRAKMQELVESLRGYFTGS